MKQKEATAIPFEVKLKVYHRDNKRCIICGRFIPYDEETKTWIGGGSHCHYIRRSQGGLGIEENIVTLCNSCHYEFDEGKHHQEIRDYISEYLDRFYPDFEDENRVYHKYNF